MQGAYVVLLMGALWMSEIIPLAITALLPVILFPIFGILDAHEVSVVYLSVRYVFLFVNIHTNILPQIVDAMRLMKFLKTRDKLQC